MLLVARGGKGVLSFRLSCVRGRIVEAFVCSTYRWNMVVSLGLFVHYHALLSLRFFLRLSWLCKMFCGILREAVSARPVRATAFFWAGSKPLYRSWCHFPYPCADGYSPLLQWPSHRRNVRISRATYVVLVSRWRFVFRCMP